MHLRAMVWLLSDLRMEEDKIWVILKLVYFFNNCVYENS